YRLVYLVRGQAHRRFHHGGSRNQTGVEQGTAALRDDHHPAQLETCPCKRHRGWPASAHQSWSRRVLLCQRIDVFQGTPADCRFPEDDLDGSRTVECLRRFWEYGVVPVDPAWRGGHGCAPRLYIPSKEEWFREVDRTGNEVAFGNCDCADRHCVERIHLRRP